MVKATNLLVYKVSMHVQPGNFYLRNTKRLWPKLRLPANIVSEFGYPTHHKYRLPLVTSCSKINACCSIGVCLLFLTSI